MTLDPSIGQVLFDDVVGRYVGPEIARRRVGTSDPIYRFQVLFPVDGAPEVRLNREVGGMIIARAARELSAAEGVAVEDIAEILSYEPQPADVDVRHVTGFAYRDGWSLVFELRGGHPTRDAFLDRGRQFLATAREAAEAERYGPFVDNAFSACELLAKAELLSSRPTVDLVLDRATHRAVSTAFNLWANLGNTERRFAKMLGRLAELRGAGRYVAKDLLVQKADALEILEVLDEMEVHVTAVVTRERALLGEDVHTFFAKRPPIAGQLVTTNDVTIVPHRGPGKRHTI